MLKILFVGGMFFERSRENVQQNTIGFAQNAANLLQWNYVKGIEQNTGKSVDILNAYFIGWYPKRYRRLFLKAESIIREEEMNSEVKEIGFINFPVIDTVTKKLGFEKALKKWSEKYQQDDKYVIGYGFFEEILHALSYAKLLDPKIKTALIVLDLPEYMDQENRHKKIKKKFVNRVYSYFEKNRCNIDYYAMITDYVAERLNVKDNYVVIEGMIDETANHNRNIMPLNAENSNRFVFLYAGHLYEAAGIRNLIDSFMKIKKSVAELWICGDGTVKEYVEECSLKDCRIKYYGTVPQQKVFELQKHADCLINPRNNSEFTKYSFPSKTMEYLLSGVPVIAKRLDGMLEEFGNYFIAFEKDSELKSKMEFVMELGNDEKEKLVNDAKQFVIREKNRLIQTKKLLDLMRVKG